jgi:hypothetical protein
VKRKGKEKEIAVKEPACRRKTVWDHAKSSRTQSQSQRLASEGLASSLPSISTD